MANIYQFASEQWQMIPDVRDEIMDELEKKGKGEAFEEVEALLGEQLAAAQRASEREAWGQNVLALIQAMPMVRKALGLPRGGSFGFDKESLRRAKEFERERGRGGGVIQEISQPAVDEKPLSFTERFRRVLAKLTGAERS